MSLSSEISAKMPIENITSNFDLSSSFSSAQPFEGEFIAPSLAEVPSPLDNISQATEEEMINDMRSTINIKAMEVAKEVNRSAFKYIYKNTNWLNKETGIEAEKFFTLKVPKILAQELSKILNDALGLSPDN